MPFKANADRRHHIPKQKHKVTNWREYDASLCQRGSLTVWFSAEAIEGWRAAPRTTRGGQPWSARLRAGYAHSPPRRRALIGGVLRPASWNESIRNASNRNQALHLIA